MKDKFGQIAIQNLPKNSHLMSHVLSAGLICRSQVAGRGLQVNVSLIQKVS